MPKVHDLNNPDFSVPDQGIRLAEAPSQDELTRFDTGYLVTGAKAEGVYLGETYGIVVYPDGTARAFPLAADDVMIVRTCDGSFAQRVLRQTS